MPRTTDPDEALTLLKEGNKRFVSGSSRSTSLMEQLRESIEAQRPFAIVLGCSDSRVPAEIVFDQGIGDLFVIRIAGNIVAPSQIGSVEFAATSFGTSLVVVLGHTRCGAIDATLSAVRDPSAETSPGIRAIVDRIRPALAPLEHAMEEGRSVAVRATRSNVRASVDALSQGSAIISGLVEARRLRVLGALYDVETGVVSFFDGN